jgi:protocatechuate 3,4-dioxygenase beta subunit
VKIYLILAVVALAAAQDQGEPGSIRGVVRGEAGGQPLAGVDVRAGRIETRTDSAGRYSLTGVPPGRRQVIVGMKSRSAPVFGAKTVTLLPGQEVSLDFSLPVKGTISGKVFDHNDEPLPGVEVALMAREYGAGMVREYRRNVAVTNDEGEYRMQSVEPGVPYLLLFRKLERRKMNPISEVPLEPKLRRPAVIPTYYSGAADSAGATPITLRGGEHRQEVNVRLLRAESYCIDGVLTAGGRPAAMTFQIQESHLSFGLGPSGGVTGVPEGGESGPGGRIRICDLHPGDYRLTAFTGDINCPESIATIPVSIRDRDERNVTVQPVPRLLIPVELAWANGPPEKPVAASLGVSLMSMTRSFGAFASTGRAAPPAQLKIKGNTPGEAGLLMDDYYVRVVGLTGRLYVKEILYGGENVIYAPLQVGSAPAGTSLRVAVGHDGGVLRVRVADEDGNPKPDAGVVLWPATAVSDTVLPGLLVTGQADQHGEYVSRALMPGKYFAFATASPSGALNPEFLAKVRSLRSHAREVAVPPNGTAELKLAPIPE